MRWNAAILTTAALVFSLGGGAACERRAQPAAVVPMKASSSDYIVKGEFQFLNCDRVDAIRIENGHIIVDGPPSDLAVDLPASVDPTRRVTHWALVTDAHVDGHRMLTFTESESVKDFSVELPDGDAPLHFTAFAARTGHGEVLIFASGDRSAGSPSFVGHVAIDPK